MEVTVIPNPKNNRPKRDKNGAAAAIGRFWSALSMVWLVVWLFAGAMFLLAFAAVAFIPHLLGYIPDLIDRSQRRP